MTTIKDYYEFLGECIERVGNQPLHGFGYSSSFYLYTVATDQLRAMNKGMERKNRLIARLREEIKELKKT